MKALISTIEPRETGYRVAQVEEESFPVAEPVLFWVDCDNTIVADRYWFDPTDNSFKAIISTPESIEASRRNHPATRSNQNL
jgi:hypothetical protein